MILGSKCLKIVCLVTVAVCRLNCKGAAAEPALLLTMRLGTEPNRVVVTIDNQKVTHYVFNDASLPRPFFAHVKTLSGKQVTRNYPPVEGVDKSDHANMHPGIWLSFGDLNGHDYWRLKARTQHVRFLAEPQVESGVGRFKVLNRYLATDSLQVDLPDVVCEEECEVQFQVIDAGCFTITIVSDFKAMNSDVRFGDQEEMGLGVRVATPLAVDEKQGGRILDSEGRINGEQVWGKPAQWCDYAGPLGGSWCGITVMASPQNFRSSWSHARNYGFIAMNPFGLNAFTKAPKQDIVLKQGETLRLSYAVAIHEHHQQAEYQPEEVCKRFIALEKK